MIQVTVPRAQAPAGIHVCAVPWPRSLPPEDARDCAPGMISLIIIIMSLGSYWTCELAVLGLGAALEVGRRSGRSPSPPLLGFFIVHLAATDLPNATAIASLPPATRFSPALDHLGRARPLGVVSSRARAVMHLARSAPAGVDPTSRTSSNCFPVDSSAAFGLTREQSPRTARVATWGPGSSVVARLDVHLPHLLLRPVSARLAALGGDGGYCGTALARASSQGGQGQDGTRRPRRLQESAG